MFGYLVKYYFWMYLWGFFPKRSVFDSVDGVEKICPHPCVQASSNPLGAQKRKGRTILSWAGASIFSCCQTWELPVPGFSDSSMKFSNLLVLVPLAWTACYTSNSPGSPVLTSVWFTPWAFLDLQILDSQRWDFSASLTCEPVHKINLRHICI